VSVAATAAGHSSLVLEVLCNLM